MLTRSSSRAKYVPNSFIKNYDDVEFNNIENKLLNWHLPMVKPNKIYNTGMFDFISSMSIKTENKLLNWHLPMVKPNKIYNTGMFDFISSMSIKTVEQTIPIGNNFDSLQLFHEDEILCYKDKYKYIHFGLIQVAIKLLTSLGLNASLLIDLRDCRHNKFLDSLLGMIQTSLCDGPVYFNCFPNFSVSMTDKHILDTLTLNIQMNGYDLKEGCEHINVTYKVHYKVMNTLSPNAKRYDPKGKTTIIETNILKSDIVVPRTIKWNEIEMPEQWLLEAVAPPIPVENRKVEEILQFEDGDVIVRFDNNKTSLSTSSSRRPSSAVIRTDSSRFYTPTPTINNTLSSSNFVAGESEIKNREDLNFDGIINFQQNIPHGVYSKTKNEPDTLSELGFSAKQVMTLTKSEFSYKRTDCNKEFMQEKYNDFRSWFFKEFSHEQQQAFKTAFYEHIDENEQVIPFVTWFYNNYGGDYPFICTIDSFFKTWKTASRTSIKSLHPLTGSLRIELKGNQALESNAFSTNVRITSSHIGPEDLNKVIKQNNYTNLQMRTIASQLTRIEETLNKLQAIEENKPIHVIEKHKVETSYVKPTIELTEGFKTSKSKNKEIVDALTEKLEKLCLLNGKNIIPISQTEDISSLSGNGSCGLSRKVAL
ncbi:hypothetical protein LguiB_013896 [Lonicera macranthoides]